MRRGNKRIPKGFPAWMYKVTQERSRKRDIILSIGQQPQTGKSKRKKAREEGKTNEHVQ